MLKSSEYMMLEDYIRAGVIKTFGSRKQAGEYAKSIGWSVQDAIRIQRRFENIWIIAQHRLGNEIVAGISFDSYVCPVKYELINGVQTMKTVNIKKYLH